MSTNPMVGLPLRRFGMVWITASQCGYASGLLRVLRLLRLMKVADRSSIIRQGHQRCDWSAVAAAPGRLKEAILNDHNKAPVCSIAVPSH